MIPKRYADKTLDNFEEERHPGHVRALAIARRFVANFKKVRNDPQNGICLVGPPGTGKSHLAYAILNELLAKHLVVGAAGTVPEILDALRPTVGDKGQTLPAENRLEFLKTADIVVLDDLGVERQTEWALERLFVLLNARYNNQLPTIITSNLRLEEVDASLEWERIVSRIKEMCVTVVIDGQDYRRG